MSTDHTEDNILIANFIQWNLDKEEVEWDGLNEERRKDFELMVEQGLIALYLRIQIDKPDNHDHILQYVIDDIMECTKWIEWHDGDIAIAFRRWIEAQENQN